MMHDLDDLVRALRDLVTIAKGIERELKTANYIRMCEIKKNTEPEEKEDAGKSV